MGGGGFQEAHAKLATLREGRKIFPPPTSLKQHILGAADWRTDPGPGSEFETPPEFFVSMALFRCFLSA